MATILKLKDIDEAITGLGYKNKNTLKCKLVHAIREYYPDEISTESIQAIDTEELVKKLWSLDGDSELLKSKKKNLSSVKSGINADLKKLYQEGKNPQGVVIGQSNVFDMSDEAKNRALGTLDAILREEGTDAIRKITEMLNAVNDILTESGSKPKAGEGVGSFDQMKQLLLHEGEVGRDVGEHTRQAEGPALHGQGQSHVPRGGLHHTLGSQSSLRFKRPPEHLEGRGPFQVQGRTEVHQLGEDFHLVFGRERVQRLGQLHQRRRGVLIRIKKVSKRQEYVLLGFVLFLTAHINSNFKNTIVTHKLIR